MQFPDKKQNRIEALLPKLIYICLLILLILYFFIILNINNKDNELTFSHPSGFYSNEFDLEIKGRGNIYYTLDGSVPTEKSIKYTGPIHISDATSTPNRILSRNDTSLCLREKEMKDFGLFKPCFYYYKKPNFNVDKITIIRAVLIDKHKNKSKVKTSSYFVKFDKKKGYNDIKIISLVTDPKNLFDYTSGIYVLGKNYDEYKQNIKSSLKRIDYLDDFDTNYNKRGFNSERPANIEIYDNKKNLILNKDIGIRIHGGSTRLNINKSFNLYARKKYDGTKFFKKTINQGSLQKVFTLHTTSLGMNRYIDYLIQNCLKNKNIGILNFEPCILFLNGEYMGLYFLSEKINKYFIAHQYGLNNVDNIVIIKNNQIENGSLNDYQNYLDMISFLKNNDLSKEANYEKFKKNINIESLINYYSINTYIKNIDFGFYNNIVIWKYKSQTGKNKNNKFMADGKWNFEIYDLNYSLSNAKNDFFNKKKLEDELFSNLMSNKIFKHKFTQSIIKLSLDEFNSSKVINLYEKDINKYYDTIEKTFDIYVGKEFIKNDSRNFKDIEQFFINRPKEIYEEYCKELDYNQKTEEKVRKVCEQYR